MLIYVGSKANLACNRKGGYHQLIDQHEKPRNSTKGRGLITYKCCENHCKGGVPQDLDPPPLLAGSTLDSGLVISFYFFFFLFSSLTFLFCPPLMFLSFSFETIKARLTIIVPQQLVYPNHTTAVCLLQSYYHGLLVIIVPPKFAYHKRASVVCLSLLCIILLQQFACHNHATVSLFMIIVNKPCKVIQDLWCCLTLIQLKGSANLSHSH